MNCGMVLTPCDVNSVSLNFSHEPMNLWKSSLFIFSHAVLGGLLNSNACENDQWHFTPLQRLMAAPPKPIGPCHSNWQMIDCLPESHSQLELSAWAWVTVRIAIDKHIFFSSRVTAALLVRSS